MSRQRYLTAEELPRLKAALDEKLYRKGTRAINQTFYRLLLIVLVALTTGMRSAEIFGLGWSDGERTRRCGRRGMTDWRAPATTGCGIRQRWSQKIAKSSQCCETATSRRREPGR